MIKSIGIKIQTLKDFAENENGKCLSSEYIKSNTKYKWQCQHNHINPTNI